MSSSYISVTCDNSLIIACLAVYDESNDRYVIVTSIVMSSSYITVTCDNSFMIVYYCLMNVCSCWSLY